MWHHKSWPTWHEISADFVTKVPSALKRNEKMSVGVFFLMNLFSISQYVCLLAFLFC